MDCTKELISALTNLVLCVSALDAARHLFKDHRASSLGFLLIGCSSVLSILSPTSQAIISIQKDLEWAGEALGPALCTFDFLWHSEDHFTAWILLTGSTLLLMLSDWLSPEGLMIMSCCLVFSSLSCSLTVCAFAESAAGAAGSIALSVSLFLSRRSRSASLGSLISPEVAVGLFGWALKVITALGCWTIRKAHIQFLTDLKGWD